MLLVATLLAPGAALAEGSRDLLLPRARPGLDSPPAYLRSQGAATEDSVAAPRQAVGERSRPTHAKSGARAGMIVGAVGGAGFAVFIGLLAEALCESGECDDITAPGWVGLVFVGGTLGAAAGALLGGILGATIPAKEEGGSGGGHSPLTPPAPVPTRKPEGRGTIASLTVQPGVGILTDRSGATSAFTLRAALLAQLKPWFAMGPEVTRSSLAGGFTAVEGLVQVGNSRRPLHPYVVGDLGLHSWDTGPLDVNVNVLGAGIGAGVAWSPRSGRWRFGLEGRYHWTPQNIESPEAYRFVNLGATARLNW